MPVWGLHPFMTLMTSIDGARSEEETACGSKLTSSCVHCFFFFISFVAERVFGTGPGRKGVEDISLHFGERSNVTYMMPWLRL